MVKTRFRSIDKSTQKTKEWLHEFEEEVGWEDDNTAYITFRSVIQTLRDRLPVEEAVDLADELPMVMKGMYYEGYRASGKPEKIKNREDFFKKVQEKSPNKEIMAQKATKAVFSFLEKKLGSTGEINQVKGNLPKDLQQFWEQ
ncbi:MAG: DUF2267 domain-containing protein [Methanobacterium sp.]